MRQERVHVMAGNAFAISDAQGDVEGDPTAPTGLFSWDTRFLAHWVLRIDGERLQALSRDDVTYFETRFFLVPGTASHYVDADVSVIRHRSLNDSFNERLIVLNHSPEPAELTVRMEIGTDFADIADVTKPGSVRDRRVEVVPDSQLRQLRLRYRRERFGREAVVTSTEPVEVDERGMTFRAQIEPHGQWETDLHVGMTVRGEGDRDMRADLATHRLHVHRDMREDLRGWLERAPTLVTDNNSLQGTYQRSLVDLAALRYEPLSSLERMPVGGLPWAMSLYGRDALVTCLQTLPFTPELAPVVLRLLALLQGGQLDDTYEEEPGKILAELRYGEAAAFGHEPTTMYYGAADTTPLFVILLDEYERWSGDTDLVRELRHPARLALDWIDEYGDSLGDGYVRYQRRNRHQGLVNQCWKDSAEAITDRDGRQPEAPRATCEVQGYAYAAKLRGARLARQVWGDPEYGDRLEREAAQLKQRFNTDFWLADRQYYALALGPDGAPVDALTSNLGHLLWSGIVPAERAGALAEHLLGPDLLSGWGVRTLAAGQRVYNPVGSHLGAVWPWDNAIVASGLRRYHFDAEAARIADGMFAMAARIGGPAPEVIAGYPRTLTKYPVQLPIAGHPQAWSSGGLLMLLATVLGLRPCGDDLLVRPALPAGLGQIELLDIPGKWGRSDAYGRDRADGVPTRRPGLS
ncbi:amylo-alpha-1,6-glucosidase [Salinispora mooreana]|uniref:amylo-alpha-1,6-glucosidase n=1 Tax=Salinispora mooreana TaxID=999545 RepID=UPI0003A2F5E5|nr:glycogen debranching N-terminal domain-containing protein [Salinispora mooreana]